MRTKKAQAPPAIIAWIYVMRLYNLVGRCAQRDLARHGLTLSRFDIIAQLGALGVEDCCSQGALCDRLLVTKGNVSGLLHRMVGEGLVSREEDPENRRCNRVRLTAKGQRLRDAVVPEQEACIDGMFSVLSRTEQEQLRNILRKLLCRISALESGSEYQWR